MIRKIIFLEMLLLGIATFLYSQDEISKITITHGPYLQNVGSNEATIVWITDKLYRMGGTGLRWQRQFLRQRASALF